MSRFDDFLHVSFIDHSVNFYTPGHLHSLMSVHVYIMLYGSLLLAAILKIPFFKKNGYTFFS